MRLPRLVERAEPGAVAAAPAPAAGFDAHVTKPVLPERLAAIIAGPSAA